MHTNCLSGCPSPSNRVSRVAHLRMNVVDRSDRLSEAVGHISLQGNAAWLLLVPPVPSHALSNHLLDLVQEQDFVVAFQEQHQDLDEVHELHLSVMLLLLAQCGELCRRCHCGDHTSRGRCKLLLLVDGLSHFVRVNAGKRATNSNPPPGSIDVVWTSSERQCQFASVSHKNSLFKSNVPFVLEYNSASARGMSDSD